MGKARNNKFVIRTSSILSLLIGVEDEKIDDPLVQRPFVWSDQQVLDLIDSLYRGYPVGHIIVWPSSGAPFENHAISADKMAIIDGQQRMNAIRAALFGQELFDDGYQKRRIQISFRPIDEKFRMATNDTASDSSWIDDIAVFFKKESTLAGILEAYCAENPNLDKEKIRANLDRLARMGDSEIGVIALSSDIDVRETAEIFIRSNLALANTDADFAMARLSTDNRFGGRDLQKGIESFAQLIVQVNTKNAFPIAERATKPKYYDEMKWLRIGYESIYLPSVDDIIETVVASSQRITSMKLLLGGLVETHSMEKSAANSNADVEETHAELEKCFLRIIDERNFKGFCRLLHEAGFTSRKLLRDVGNDLNLVYGTFIMFQNEQPSDTGQFDRLIKSLFLAILLMREPQASTFFANAQQSPYRKKITLGRHKTQKPAPEALMNSMTTVRLTNAFWTETLPSYFCLDRRNIPPTILNVFIASQIYSGDMGFLSRSTKISSLMDTEYSLHHIYPSGYLKNTEYQTDYDQNSAANVVVLEKSINEDIGARAPQEYFGQLKQQCEDGKVIYGDITDLSELQKNFAQHCIPFSLDELPYDDFIKKRSKLIAAKIRRYFESL